jgi:hypothetical protein
MNSNAERGDYRNFFVNRRMDKRSASIICQDYLMDALCLSILHT